MMLVRPFLRASTSTQDAGRAREELRQFVEANGLTVGAWYEENESGATLERKKLFDLVDDSNPGDVILLEQVDRLSRLNAENCATLKQLLAAKQIRVMAFDLPTSHILLKESPVADGMDFTTQMRTAINGMMLDMLSVISRKDYLDRMVCVS